MACHGIGLFPIANIAAVKYARRDLHTRDRDVSGVLSWQVYFNPASAESIAHRRSHLEA
jgi:hypothetical protein